MSRQIVLISGGVPSYAINKSGAVKCLARNKHRPVSDAEFTKELSSGRYTLRVFKGAELTISEMLDRV
ncbi:hypothetical protein HC723_09870 [Vibrio sp. S11_S32]|uniref:hypothetical protein n=1 Tax=Vibrio sp. S11_S32 TaxID=2720225 RepID=UPI0016815B01|nr:hypothetical protein [Vibrio sp. S11_S32]MBD1576743.1 hypothetical protein [Vibrio sp. S11_S32]